MTHHAPFIRTASGISLLRGSVVAAAMLLAAPLVQSAHAGPVFITGHDPDFHTQFGSPGAERLLETGLNFVTNGTWNQAGHKFLWVESNDPVIGGHIFGEGALTNPSLLNLTAGVNFDQVNAAGLVSANFSNYSAIVVASSFGGMLTQAEINELIARKADIASFVNGGGGIMAMAECVDSFVNCPAGGNVTNAASLFGFLPVSATSVNENPPFTITPFGTTLGAPFGLGSGDLQDPTHNSFAPIAGLSDVDLDASNNPTTLAGNVGIGQTGFTPAPEPATITLLGAALAGIALRGRRRRS